MQLRAGIVYIVLFLVVAAGAYGVIATAEAPDVAIDQADADYELSTGDDFTVGDNTYNVSELDGVAGTATLERTVDATFDRGFSAASAAEGDAWDAGEAITFEDPEDENATEYHFYLYAPAEPDDDDEDADDEPMPETALLIESFDDENVTVVERDDGVYIAVEDDDGSETLEHVMDVEEIESEEYAVGETFTYFEEDEEAQIDSEIVEFGAGEVTVEYEGEETETADLDHNQVAIVDGEEYGVHFPGGDRVFLTEDIESFEAQHQAVEDHSERVHGLWWIIGLALSTVALLAGLAFMPSRG